MHLQEPAEGHSAVLLSQVRYVFAGAVWLVETKEKLGLEAGVISIPCFAIH